MSVKFWAIIIIFNIIVLPSLATEFLLPDKVVQQGEEVVIPVKITQVKGMVGVSMEMRFDPEIISIKSVSKTELVKNFMFAHNTPSPGNLLIAMTSGRGASGEGILVNIHIKVSENTDDGQICPLEFGTVSLNGANIETVQNGRLFIGHITSIKKFRKKAIVWGRLKRS